MGNVFEMSHLRAITATRDGRSCASYGGQGSQKKEKKTLSYRNYY